MSGDKHPQEEESGVRGHSMREASGASRYAPPSQRGTPSSQRLSLDGLWALHRIPT